MLVVDRGAGRCRSEKLPHGAEGGPGAALRAGDAVPPGETSERGDAADGLASRCGGGAQREAAQSAIQLAPQKMSRASEVGDEGRSGDRGMVPKKQTRKSDDGANEKSSPCAST